MGGRDQKQMKAGELFTHCPHPNLLERMGTSVADQSPPTKGHVDVRTDDRLGIGDSYSHPMTHMRPETYATTRITQVVRQALGAIVAREAIEQQVDTFASRLLLDEARIANTLGRPVHGLEILEIGAGQQCERARYFGQRNSVTAVDLDWIPRGSGVADYLVMLRRNGIGRLIKTAGRRILLVDRARRHAWARAVGTDRFR